MPCLIVTGHPSAGKTTLSRLLKERALKHSSINDVILINEEAACPDFSTPQCYETSAAEKQTRAALKAAFDRAPKLSSTLVILDSLNYIKGFRYELHCISKASGERHGILWVLNRLDVIEKWNQDRTTGYPPELLKELIQRYEPPDERNRWDKPLYTVDVSGDASKGEALAKSVYNMHALGETLGAVDERSGRSTVEKIAKKKPTKSAFSRIKKTKPVTSSATSPGSMTTTIQVSPEPDETKDSPERAETKSLEEQLDEILDSFLLRVQPLKEGNSTRQHIAGNADILQELDSTTQRLISAIVSAQNLHTGGDLQVKCGSGTIPMTCKRTVALPELRRLRKQYLQWLSSHPPDDSTERGIATSFLQYIEDQL